MHVNCPHCNNPIEIVNVTPWQEIACPSCGSSFRLEERANTDVGSSAGHTIGRFQVQETLGQGAFGTVYKARDPELDRAVAIKVPRAGNLAGPQELDRFLREARSVAQLRHPSIVSVHEVGQQGGLPYLVSDFVKGVTLADLLSARRFSFRESAELVAAVADALQYAHDRGVVHRDVKPSNIMIGDDGKPCVMDFGLAKREAGEITMTVEGQVLGTPAYMPPEQARGEGHAVNARADIYSLGVVLYQLLTGELPFRGTQRMLLHQVMHDDPRPPRRLNDTIPRDLEAIVLRCMEKEPVRRYATAADVAADLGRWLRDEAVVAQPPSTFYLLRKQVRRHRVPLTVAAVVVLVIVSVVAAAFWQINDALGRATEAKGQALTNQRTAETKEQEAKDSLAKEQKALADLGAQLSVLARSYYDRGDSEFRKGNVVDSLNWTLRAYDMAPADDPRRPSYREALAAQARALGSPLQHGGSAIAFSPDGRAVLAGGSDGTARLRDAATGQTLGEPLGKPLRDSDGESDGVLAVAFSPDGRAVLTGGSDGTARLWDSATGKPLGEPLRHGANAQTVAFSRDGRVVLTAGRMWHAVVVPPPDEVARLRAWIAVKTGKAFDDQGTLRQLTDAEWRERLQEWEASGGDWEPVGGRWHHSQAAEAEAAAQWFAAAFHLKQLLAHDPNDADLQRRLKAVQERLAQARP
jgi:tRNA A-37 threonylcarbamoyl transferase component Bud32